MRPGPASAVKLLPSVVTIDAPPKEAKAILVEIAMHEEWVLSRSDAAESAERWEKGFLRRLRRELSRLVDQGRVTHFALNSSSQTMIQGAAFVEPGVDSQATREAKAKRSEFSGYMSLFPTMSPDDFEVLCNRLLSLVGVADRVVTPHGNDQGIDFYGRLQIKDLIDEPSPLPSLYDVMHVWMVGQAKHYQATQAATPDIREVVGSVDLARGKAFGIQNDAYPDLDIRVCDPVFFLFFTTGRISSDGWQLLSSSGVVGMDGEMVAAFLADHGVARSEEGVDQKAFRAWLEGD